MQANSSPPDVILSVKGLGVVAGKRVILEDVSFDLPRGETLAIVGPNGSGKTTLLKALMSLVPHSGIVTWAGNVSIGFVPQSLVTMDMPISVREFLNMKRKSGLETCIRSVGLDPGILDQSLGSLSGGELQRVLIAWAIIDEPNVLLFDEPTSGVDIGAEEPIYENLNRLKKALGITTLLISHNMHVVMHYSDYVMALSGRALYFGKTSGVSHSKLLEIIYGEGFSMAANPEE